METPEGDWAVEELRTGRVTYVPPRWAHRSVNIDAQDPLITFIIYPGNAGHDYGTIEQFGFRKMVIDHAGLPAITDNPRWKAPAERKSE
jgi:glucose-6-phosphate isomerase